jgi:hypothetical protein
VIRNLYNGFTIDSSTPRSIMAKHLARHFVPRRSRVLIPGPADMVGMGFFQGFSHTITSWYEHRFHIIDKSNAGSVLTPRYLYPLPSASIFTVPIPNLPVSVALESLSSRPPSGGGMKDVSFPFFFNAYYEVKLKKKHPIL